MSAQKVFRVPIKSPTLQNLTITPDGKWLICLSHKGRLLIIDTEKGHISRSIKCLERRSDIYTLKITQDGKYVLATTYMVAKVIDFHSGQSVLKFKNVKESVFSPDGASIVVALEDGTIELWNIEKRQKIASLDTQLNHVGATAVNDDLTQLWTYNWEAGIIVWDWVTKTRQAQYWAEQPVDSLELTADNLTVVCRHNIFRLEQVSTSG